MENIRQKIKKFFKKTGYGIAALLIVANVFALINEKSLIQLSSREAEASTTAGTTFSIRCQGVNSLTTRSQYEIVTLFGNGNENPSMAISALDSGETITQAAVKNDTYEINGKKHTVAIFDGPQVKHFAACIGRKVNSGHLSAAQTSNDRNPPLLMASGNETNVGNFKKIPNNNSSVAVVSGAKFSGNAAVRINYGKGTNNPYRIAVANPQDQSSGSQSYSYLVSVSSTLD